MYKYFILLLSVTVLFSCKPKYTYVSLQTTKGEIVVKLYDETPLHKENFISLVEDEFYDSLLFHRVINNFMIQGGDPASKYAKDGELVGDTVPEYKVDAEFNDSLFHKKGALAAAHDGNEENQSDMSQFYIVEGKTFTDSELDQIEANNEIQYTNLQRETYKTIGGYAPLDQNYTVFGEVVKGIEILSEISDVEVDRRNRPIENVRILNAEIVKFKE